MKSYDVIVVGGGPAGYVAAMRASKNGKKTALVEAGQLGGTCLNRGCIPSKTLLRHAEVINTIEKAKDWGIKVENVSLSFIDMKKRKDQVIQNLRSGIELLLKNGKIDVYSGEGIIHDNKKVLIKDKNASQLIYGEKIIIATGSSPIIPGIKGLDEVDYYTTDTIFDIEEIPKSIAIVGGGVIGVEFSEIFSSLQTNVSIIELSDRIIPTEDKSASEELSKYLKKKGVEIYTKSNVTLVEKGKNGGLHIHLNNEKEKEVVLEVDNILVAVGRKPNLSAVSELDLKMNGRFIAVNEYLETSKKDYFAIGDVIGGFQLAHVASAEGLTAASNLDGAKIKMNYDVIPRCIYTSPQVASIGMTENQLKDNGIKYKVDKYYFSTNGKALTLGEPEGFTKIMIDEKFGEILGAVMVGPSVTELIGQMSTYRYLEGTIEELATMIQPHPSLSEAFMELANKLLGKGIHTI